MGKRKFDLTFTVECTIEVDDLVIDVVDQDWRDVLYDLETPEQIVEMVARNMLQGRSLDQLDGWADQPYNNAIIRYDDWYCEEARERK